jgi:oligoribonuclease
VNFLWLDLETTGLSSPCSIIQVGTIVTTPDLIEVARQEWLVRPPANAIWEVKAREMHEASGLRERAERHGEYLQNVDDFLYEFILRHAGEKPVLSGNSIHFDRRFLQNYMPFVLDILHYRMLDLSVFKVLREAWGLPMPERGPIAHTALADLENSIAELRQARRELLTQGPVL